ncbi:nicotinate-nucleotide--dimethylbenzimidazole phosphoribosyltransferase [Pseudomonas sp. F1_0610]|uniref:nicotinate-nucleotide--dimethylbenzimidazole phosphoribosyltransferase n=1 Tax=Pseudomonas sp. F1_0610 TaxID=3114284 RepID=UPI0039C2AF21
MWWKKPALALNRQAQEQAAQHNADLTKPLGSLGYLEQCLLHLAAMQGVLKPHLDRVWISVFAADHGVTEEGISAYPARVTRQMLGNFVQGGAAISVLAKQLDAYLEVIDCGILQSAPKLEGVLHQPVAKGTANFTQQPAMTAEQLEQALSIGRQAVQRAKAQGVQLFIAGEMGIGNTTTASALACALLNQSAQSMVDKGTGLNPSGVQHKINVIDQALALHQLKSQSPFLVLQSLGGFEVAAITGAYIAAAQCGLSVLVDGFICSVAALCAQALNPASINWMLFAHQSAEIGHKAVLKALQVRPLLALDLCLGEASGAALAVPLLRNICMLNANMATFSQARVDRKSICD